MDWIPVTGESMAPFLPPGSSIGVRWLAPGEDAPSLGDLVLFRGSDGSWIVHRLVGAAPGGTCLLKGDASTVTDVLEKGQLWGVVTAVRGPRGGVAAFRPGILDRWIARCSREGTGRGPAPALWRRLAKGLARLRSVRP